jgi:hypothetical protein
MPRGALGAPHPVLNGRQPDAHHFLILEIADHENRRVRLLLGSLSECSPVIVRGRKSNGPPLRHSVLEQRFEFFLVFPLNR